MAYTSAQLFEKIKQIVAKEIGVDESEITPKANFVDDLGADSLDVVELVIALKKARHRDQRRRCREDAHRRRCPEVSGETAEGMSKTEELVAKYENLLSVVAFVGES